MKIADMLKSSLVSLYASIRRFPIALGLSASASIFLLPAQDDYPLQNHR